MLLGDWFVQAQNKAGLLPGNGIDLPIFSTISWPAVVQPPAMK